MLLIDLKLSQRLERTEAAAGVSFVEARAPSVGARWQDFGGATAIFDGADSSFTQTFGLGLFSPVTAESLGPLEAFFRDRGAAVLHEVSPLAGIETSSLLAERGYRPVELTTVLAQSLEQVNAAEASPGLTVRACAKADFPAWVAASVGGWGDSELSRSIADQATRNPRLLHFGVEREGAMIATASMLIHESVALLVGASTVPDGRGLGAQAMLLSARLLEAKRQGCELAMIGAAPGSGSQRNAERRGFQVAYSRTKWRLGL